eukprot:PhM_4_TR13343/c0_g1_i1/m.69190
MIQCNHNGFDGRLTLLITIGVFLGLIAMVVRQDMKFQSTYYSTAGKANVGPGPVPSPPLVATTVAPLRIGGRIAITVDAINQKDNAKTSTNNRTQFQPERKHRPPPSKAPQQPFSTLCSKYSTHGTRARVGITDDKALPPPPGEYTMAQIHQRFVGQPECMYHKPFEGIVRTVYSDDVWTTWRWNQFTVSPLHCAKKGGSGGEAAPCCGGGDFLRASFTLMRDGKPDAHTLYVASHDHGNGYYTFSVFPVVPGRYELRMKSARRVRKSGKIRRWTTNVHHSNYDTLLASIEVVPAKQRVPQLPTEPGVQKPFCKLNDLHAAGVWLGGAADQPGAVYYVPERDCVVRSQWQANDIRTCLDKKFLYAAGDSTMSESWAALQYTLYSDLAWSQDVPDPISRQYDLVFTNANSSSRSPTTAPFTVRMAHMWNGAPVPLEDQVGLFSYCHLRYDEMIRNHSHTCVLQKRHRLRMPGQKPAPVDSEERTPWVCPDTISSSADIVVVASAMHDYRWMRGDHSALATYVKLWEDALPHWRDYLIPSTTPLVVRASPTSSLRFRHENVHVDMLNRITCSVARRHGVPCLDPNPMTYPFADSDQTDGHHWMRNFDGERRYGTVLGEKYMSIMYSALCVP